MNVYDQWHELDYHVVHKTHIVNYFYSYILLPYLLKTANLIYYFSKLQNFYKNFNNLGIKLKAKIN